MIWGKKKILLKNPVLIDGISRSGKSIISKILPSLSNSEHLKVFTYFEHIMPALYYKEIKFNYIDAQLIIMLNELAYNTFIGRDVNFRPSDYTSVTSKNLKKRYLDRLKSKEGDFVIKKLIKTKNFFPFMAHEIMPNLGLLNKLTVKFKIIEFYRNPVDNIYSWIQKKVCNDFIKNPRSFTLVVKDKKSKKNIPWFCGKDSKQWLKLNEYEKSVFGVCKLLEMSIRNQKMNKKTKILTLSFENFYKEPFSNIMKISNFLNSRSTNLTKIEIKKSNCPRIENIELRKKKETFIKEKVSKELFIRMKDLEKNYEKNIFGLSK